MNRTEYQQMVREKEELAARIAALQEELAAAVTGETEFGHTWDVDEKIIQITVPGGATAGLAVHDLGDILMAVSLRNKEALDEILAPFVETAGELPLSPGEPENGLKTFISTCRQLRAEAPEDRMYVRVRQGPTRSDLRNIEKSKTEIEDPELGPKLVKIASASRMSVVVAEVMHRKSRHNSSVTLRLFFRDKASLKKAKSGLLRS